MDGLDEQIEAEFLELLKKNTGFILRSPIFLARKQFFEELISLGMPKDRAAIIIGRMEFAVNEKTYGGPVFDKLIEISAKNLFDLWKAYSEEMDELVFLESCRQYKFLPPAISRKEEKPE